MNPVEMRAAIEAILFVSDEPVSMDQLQTVFRGAEPGAIESALNELQRRHDEPGSGVMLRFVAGGWQLATRLEYHEQARRFLKERPACKLSMAALETLAIVAYRQPVTVPEILQIRGVKSSAVIKTLLEKKLIIARGRKKVLGSPMQYGTSREFLTYFGLGSLEELPSLEEFEDIFGDKADHVRQKDLFDLKLEGIRTVGAAAAPPEEDLLPGFDAEG
ncbi:MAG TPA: SMC-Scp complex subunit ScpB [Acidobacteriota bacterium]|nr:SMC-Scp complex subunit ScpB [Acidobacteriota bacterium]HQM64216.1 SMC-Scp complex subunit ScpB [Acidobacteriota bacterium]